MTNCKQLEKLHETIRYCTLCPLHETRTNAVPGEGPCNASVMFVGEAPGAEEDETGRPFVGRSGELLVSLLEEIELARDDIFITSILKSRPPKNRTPKKVEINVCRPYLEQQIELIKPRVIVLLGGVAISSLFGPRKVSESHGRFVESDSQRYFMTYHPAAALRFPKIKIAMREDFKILSQDLV
ncbi:MAG: uracil-DNA glycosylase [Candidatus Thorarchaeota archaeon]|nr:MAG: uracil-DNA glycosylase [Candidatus Thorarchaeota archaeon]